MVNNNTDVFKQHKPQIQITLQIDSADMDKGFNELISTMDMDQKQEIFKNMLSAYFSTEEPIKYYSFTQNLKKEVKETLANSHRFGTFITDYDIEKSDEYKNALQKFGKTKEGLFNMLREEVLAYTKQEIINIVKSDPEVSIIIRDIMDSIRNEMRTIILDAMVKNIADSMVLNSDKLFKNIRENMFIDRRD